MDFQTDFARARDLAQQRKFDKALALFEMLSKLAPGASATLLPHANALLECGRPEAALKRLEHTADDHPHLSKIWFLRARCHERTGNAVAGEICLHNALTLQPDHVNAHILLTQFYARRDDAEAMRRAISAFRETGLHNARMTVFQARLLEHDGDFETALKYYLELHDASTSPTPVNGVLDGIARAHIALGRMAELRAFHDAMPDTGPQRGTILQVVQYYPQSDIAEGFPLSFFRDRHLADPGDHTAFLAYADQLRMIPDIPALKQAERAFVRAAGYTIDRLAERIAAVAPPEHDLFRLSPSVLEFWRQCRQPGQNLEDWASAAARNQRAKTEIAKSLLPQDASVEAVCRELDKICHPPDMTPIDRALAQRRGCLVVGTHVCAFWTTLCYMDQRYDAHRTLGGFALHRVTAADREMFLRYDPARTMRRAVDMLKDNMLISCAPDGVQPGDPRHVYPSAFGPIALQTVHARLQYAAGAPALWLENTWHEGRLTSVFRPMPTPEPDEARDAFVDRWCRAYIDHLVDLMKHRLPVLYDRFVRQPPRGRPMLI
ncbi:tetratricopeptide repeat protein [Seohaeicola saemankumensis]|nr:tetratricopeptide repeat protein [Seohaeicola saemankumensis]MCA0872916.1 tetratricopeptide repeat protein [Seohaeicola saemankumensis]